MYNEGMAYRFCGNLPEQDSLIVADEEASFNLGDDPAVILPETTNFTAWELSNVLYEGISKILGMLLKHVVVDWKAYAV